MSARPRPILLRHTGETDLADIDQLALRAWVALLSRPDVSIDDAPAQAYQAAASMLRSMHESYGGLPPLYGRGAE